MLTINLFDDTFRHAACSTGWKTPRHIEYVRDQMEWDGITLFTDGYVNSPIVEQVKSRYKIGWLREPQCLHPENYQVADPRRFDFTLTYYEPLLEQGPILRHGSDDWFYPYRFAPYAGAWIEREHWGIRPKTKLVSMLYGSKLATEGHRIRHEIAAAVRPLGVVDFYGFEGETVDYSPATKLKVLGAYAFSIVTETCFEEHLFTEILLDCFTVGTVPIFWGCPNIGDYFNRDGLFRLSQAADEVLFITACLSFEVYKAMLPAVRENLEWVKDYEIAEDWLYENVLRQLV